MAKKLDRTDQLRELEALEAVASRGFESFVRVGEALATIRIRRLYRARYATWEEYIEKRWRGKLQVQQAKRLTSAFTAQAPDGTAVPSKVAATIQQAPGTLGVDAWKQARKEAAEKGREPGLGDVQRAVKAARKDASPIQLIREAAGDFARVIGYVSRLQEEIDALAESPWGAELVGLRSEVKGHINSVRETLRLTAPYCECLFCENGCKACRSRKPRWISYGLFRGAPKSQQNKVTEHA